MNQLNTPAARRAFELRDEAVKKIGEALHGSDEVSDTVLDVAVRAALKESGFENYPIPNLSKYPPKRILKAAEWAREVLERRKPQ